MELLPERKLRWTSPSNDENSSVLVEEQTAILTSRESEVPRPRFACPYYKNNPAKYANSYPCQGPGWHTVSKVKEHLFRRHAQPDHRCYRCGATFTDITELRSHNQALRPCEILELLHVDGFDQDQKKQLRSKKHRSQMTEYDNWRSVYRILFPSTAANEIPSPHYGPADKIKDTSKLFQGLIPREAVMDGPAGIEGSTSWRNLPETLFPAQSEVHREPVLPTIAYNAQRPADGSRQAPSGAALLKYLKLRNYSQINDPDVALHSMSGIERDFRLSGEQITELDLPADLAASLLEGEIGTEGIVMSASNLGKDRNLELLSRGCAAKSDTPVEHVGAAPDSPTTNFSRMWNSEGLKNPYRQGEESDDGDALPVAPEEAAVLESPVHQRIDTVDLGLNDAVDTRQHAPVVTTQFVPGPVLPEYGTFPDPSPASMLGQDNEKVARVASTNCYKRTNMDADTPKENELPGSREAKKDDVPYTDSGYESVQGLDHCLMQENDHERSGRAEHSDPYTASDMDDAKTSYSDFSTSLRQAAADKCVVDVCNKISSRLERSVNKRSFKLLPTILPDLIKAFAVQLGSEVPDRSNLRVMQFVHKQHRSIVSQLENSFHDDEDESTSPRQSNDAMPLYEIISKWNGSHDKEPVVVPVSELFEGVSDDEDDVDGGPVDEEDISASSEYYQMILKSAAYEWLISRLAKEASFRWDEAQPRVMVHQIRQEILSQLPTGRISSRRPPNQHTASFKIPRSSLPFLSDDARALPGRNSETVIGNWIVATSSSGEHVQLSKVSQYMDQTWPLGGGTLLSVLQNVINRTGQTKASTGIGSRSEIEVMLKDSYLEAVVTGTSYSIAEYGEQLAWLTAALQPAASDLTMYIRPLLLRIDDSTPTRDNRPSWSIELSRQGIGDVDVTARSVQEWFGDFTSPSIVQGFPTTIRPGDCPGIEVPPQLSANLLRSPLLGGQEIQFLFNSTGKVLQLFEQTRFVTIWHIIDCPGEVCQCRQDFLNNDDKGYLPCLDSVELWQHRHIITECSVAELHYRDATEQMEPGIGSTDISQRGCSLSEAPQLTSYSENGIDSLDSLDAEMLSIPDSPEGTGGLSDTEEATSPITKAVAYRLVSEYRRDTEQHDSTNGCPSKTKQSSPGGQQSSTTRGSLKSTPGPAYTQAGSTNPVRKRPVEEDDGDGDEDSQRRPTRKKQKKCDSIKGPQFFACPFWKQNPGKHSNCFGKKLDMISRVKQHLERKHSPEYCDRCLAIFPDEVRKLTHLRDEQSFCAFRHWAPLEGLTSEQRRKLSRKSDSRLTQSDKWYIVWDVVFPGHRRPSSPYRDLELSQDLNHFREFSERRAPAVLVEVMRDAGLVTLEGDEAILLAQGATDRAIRSLFNEWASQRAESSPNSGSGGSSSTDAMGEQRSQGQQRERVHRLADLRSNADSGVELRSLPSSGPSRNGANRPLFASIQPRLPPAPSIDVEPPVMANMNAHAADTFSVDSNPSQLYADPSFIDMANPDLPIQGEEDYFDFQPLNLEFEDQPPESFGFNFDTDM